jgi:dienelactone hydrolase
MRKRIGRILLVLTGLLILGLVWFSYSADATITALRNVIDYKIVHLFGGPLMLTGESPGALAGTIRDEQGQPLEGATVLVASPLGHTYVAETTADGSYHISGVPPGRYAPVAGKRGYNQAVRQSCIANLCRMDTLTIRPGTTTLDVDLALGPAEHPSIVVDDSLVVSPTSEVEVGAPFPSRALRTHFSFERDALRVNDCWLYEPLDGEEPLPTMLLVLPGPVKNWEIIPVPFAAEGFSVLACYPLRGLDVDQDAADLLTALEYLRQGRVPSRADTGQLALVGASFTSLHTYRLLGLTDQFDATLVLGGMANAFRFRHDVEMGTASARPPFDQALVALGFPNSSPELYFRYSSIFHLEGLPPVCLLHGWEDELVPFSQSVELAAELDRRGHPYEFYTYEGLSHYFSTSADNDTTQRMFRDSLACLRRFLAGD